MIDKLEYEQTIDQFLEYLNGILQLYESLLPILKEELEAIMRDDIKLLNKSLGSQQAIFLKMKSFDSQKAYFLSTLGIKAENLSDMAQQLPKDDGLRFFNLLGKYELIMAEVVYYKEKCTMLLNNKLYKIDKALSKLVTQNDNTTYNKNASEVQGKLFQKSFESKV